MAWLATANAAAIAFHDGQLRRLLRTLCQSLVSTRGRISSLCQLAPNVVHDAFDRLGRSFDVGFSQGDHAPLKGSRLGRKNADLPHDLGR
jgi:hypothetical protein